MRLLHNNVFVVVAVVVLILSISACVEQANAEQSYDWNETDHRQDSESTTNVICNSPNTPETTLLDCKIDEHDRIVYVDMNATSGTNDGTSWDNAYTDLQSALTYALPGDEIWVAEGTYKPGTKSHDSFSLENNVSVYGGFTGTETARDQRDWEHHATILSADIGEEDYKYDNCFHVFYHPADSGIDDTAILDGFIIADGEASVVSHARGGGMYNHFSSPTITNCTFRNNGAHCGGGMFNNHSSPIITNCVFENNGTRLCGAIANINSSPIITDCIFRANGSSYDSCMNNLYSRPKISNCTFQDNHSGEGAAITNEYSSAIITDCTFENNLGGIWGVINNSYSSTQITNCTIKGNRSYGFGGGIYNHHSSPEIHNCILLNNAAAKGGGIYSIYSSPTIINCVLQGNSASTGGGVYNEYSSSVVANCIIWANTADTGSQIYNGDYSDPIITYNCIEGGYVGLGNIDNDPLFVNPSIGDIHLMPGSPCIDAGNDEYPIWLQLSDFEGDDRVLDGNRDGIAMVDIGADEYLQLGDANNDGKIDGTDLIRVKNIILHSEQETPCADANRDGKINGADIIWIKKVILGID
ncbi:MAG: dockerin type I domain-containing protein [Chloroflexota bacterium]|nr:dockerin type I domain-containing protein [Chloroflexota bacterium]